MLKPSSALLAPALAMALALLPACERSSGASATYTPEAATVSADEATASPVAAALSLRLQPVAEDLTSPVGMAAPADGSGRLFVISQAGTIYVIKNGKTLPQPFLDLKSKLDRPSPGYSEKGLLGLAFHPQYKTNGRFFVYYSAPSSARGSNHKGVLAEFKVSGSNPDAAAPQERVILEVEQPEGNHNGGQVAFGPDGMLYLGLGDGGGAGDRHGTTGNGQDLHTHLGKILRIDVNGKHPYAVPADNPFLGKNAKPEIWAYGLRNPWRFSFDRKTGQLFCADVGQNEYEEVNLIEKGGNYGWRIMEGPHCFDPESGCRQEGLKLPIHEYSHRTGISVTGGYVYRGSRFPGLQGTYLYGDWGGTLLALQKSGSKWQDVPVAVAGKKGNDTNLRINSFGEDEAGEMYLIAQRSTGPHSKSGRVFRIEAEQ